MNNTLTNDERRKIRDRHAGERAESYLHSSEAGFEAGWDWAKDAAWHELCAQHRYGHGLPDDEDGWDSYREEWGDRADFEGYCDGFAEGVSEFIQELEDDDEDDEDDDEEVASAAPQLTTNS